MIDLWIVPLACWVCASCILGSVAHASKMNFVVWLMVGLTSPLLCVVLLLGCTLAVASNARKADPPSLSPTFL
jgi:hypothetical protein